MPNELIQTHSITCILETETNEIFPKSCEGWRSLRWLRNNFNWIFHQNLKETRNSSKIQPLDFDKKWKLNSKKCFVKYQWTNVRLSPLCYFANLKRCLILNGDWKIAVLENFTKMIGKHVSSFIKKCLQPRYFLVNFAKFSRTQEHLFCKTSANGCFWTPLM